MGAASIIFQAHADQGHSAKGKAHHAQPKETSFGRVGDPKKVSRTVEIDMSDKMRFTPDKLTVKRGDTVRFIATNSGKQKHEMVLGSMEGLKKHSQAMNKHPGMEHDEPYEIEAEPGKKAEMVWQFTKPGEFAFGCLLPGHFEAGMIGKITVLAAGDKK
jgi:uncharacterized cupredoxin-like copper-binding protein